MCGNIAFPKSAVEEAESRSAALVSMQQRNSAVKKAYRELTYSEFITAQLARMTRRRARTWPEGKKMRDYKNYQELYEKVPATLPKYLLRPIEG